MLELDAHGGLLLSKIVVRSNSILRVNQQNEPLQRISVANFEQFLSKSTGFEFSLADLKRKRILSRLVEICKNSLTVNLFKQISLNGSNYDINNVQPWLVILQRTGLQLQKGGEEVLPNIEDKELKSAFSKHLFNLLCSELDFAYFVFVKSELSKKYAILSYIGFELTLGLFDTKTHQEVLIRRKLKRRLVRNTQ